MKLKGTPASPGAASGPAFVLQPEPERRRETSPSVRSDEVAAETARFSAAVDETGAELETLIASAGEEAAAIFRVHLLMLADPLLVDEVRERIRAQPCRAESALAAVVEEVARSLRALEDEYLRGRAADVEDLGRRLGDRLAGDGGSSPTPPGSVVVARDLTPSQIFACSRAGTVAVALEEGAVNSHAAILARSLRLPLVVGVAGLLDLAATGVALLVDGGAGEVTSLPAAPSAEPPQPRESPRPVWQQAAFPEARTADGRRVRLYANVGRPEELDLALEAGAEGVGVLRTEFLFLAGPPSEDYQFEVYRSMAERLRGRPLIVRTLDVGGDKPLSYLGLADETNPFLGLRGLRLSLARPEVFRTQLRAILRARAYGRVSLMYPMVTDAAELVQARGLLDRARAELAERGLSAVGEVEVGAMVEVPAAAICADFLAREAAFLSVGTNDLAQYTLAADRNNPAVAGVYDQTHLAVLRLLRATVEGARRWGRSVAVCGEIASDPRALPLLVGLGVDELSVAPTSLAAVRARLAAMDFGEAVALVAGRLAEPPAEGR